MKIAISSDDSKAPLVQSVIEFVKKAGHEPVWFGSEHEDQMSWPSSAKCVAEAVAAKKCDEGIIMCWTGTGVSIAANKTQGIRAALCGDSKTAEGARLWNNANVLCLSIRATSLPVAEEILEAWFGTTYQPNEEDDACLAQLAKFGAL